MVLGQAACYNLCNLISLPHVACEMGTMPGISQGSDQIDRIASDEALGPCWPSVDDSSSLIRPRRMEISFPAWTQRTSTIAVHWRGWAWR